MQICSLDAARGDTRPPTGACCLMRKVLAFSILYGSLGGGCATVDGVFSMRAEEWEIEGWELAWQDEFEGAAIDEAKWNVEVNARGGGNREEQFYTARRENIRFEKGCLVIEAHREDYTAVDPSRGQSATRKYTSGRVTTQGKGDWTYGRVEVRAKLPTGRGMWPAIWMLGSNVEEAGWPACGEIDIMENVGYEPDTIHANAHTKSYNHRLGTQKGDRIEVTAPYEEFHVYAVEWFEDRMEFFVDGEMYFTFENEGKGMETWPFDHNHFLILNAAVGGSWGGSKGIDDGIFPQRMDVDYVRVYRQAG